MGKGWILRALLASTAIVLYSGAAFAQAYLPLYTEDFESTAKFGLPPGWSQENQTTPAEGSFVNGETTDLANSSELEGWTVLSSGDLQSINANRVNTPSVVKGNSVYAESDNRGGLQIQYLYTPVYDLSTVPAVAIQFDSNYVQNQDSIGYAEYTLQGNLANDDPNKKWLPIFYWMESSEVTAAAGDVNALFTTNGVNNDEVEPYSKYIGAEITAIDIATNIEGRIDDDQTASKKTEKHMLPNAANQKEVQIRFFQGGGGSWYWSIDNFSIGTAKTIDPVATENFESAAEFSLPTGWTQYNETDFLEGSYAAGETTNLADSSELEGWTVLTTASMEILGGSRLNTPTLVQGKSVYAESDNRGGIQAQWLYTPVYNLSTKDTAIIRFDSNYVQNQDNINYIEYTLQGDLEDDNVNKIWHPVIYYVKNTVVAAASGDVVTLMDTNGLNESTTFPYIFYIGADVEKIDFNTHIKGMLDDNATSSKGRMSFLLPLAAKQSKVQVRFFQGGGGSWYWGIDNFSIGGLADPIISTAPATPTLSVSTTQPTVSTPPVLTSSAFSGSGDATHVNSTWELSLDANFASLLYQTTTFAPDLTSLTVAANRLPFGKTVYARIKYTDSLEKSSEYSNVVTFTMLIAANTTIIWSEDFEGLTLEPFVVETTGGDGTDWTATPPQGWSINNEFLPFGGVPEWAGWTFADTKAWAAAAGDQRRYEFTKAQGTAAIADSDEWDDTGHDAGTYNTYLSTPPIPVNQVIGGEVILTFDSSWRPESVQGANLTASFDGGEPFDVVVFSSVGEDPNFKDDNSTNDSLLYTIPKPAGAANLVLTFGYFEASNNWWWAVDNITLSGTVQSTPVNHWALY